jgi:cytochrome c-type biogenesis protein CcmH
MKRLLFALLLVVTTPALAQPVGFSNPEMEARAHHLQRQLRCMVCQGQSIDESDAPLAQDLRRLVREQIAAGRSDTEILEFLHVRFGDFVLMQPPVQPYTWLLWLAPLLALGTAGAVAWSVISKAKKLPESEA